jgi:hypothetical protein
MELSPVFAIYRISKAPNDFVITSETISIGFDVPYAFRACTRGWEARIIHAEHEKLLEFFLIVLFAGNLLA